jgi:hypothetical protein
MRAKTVLWTCLLVMASVSVAVGQEALERHPGYVDFGRLGVIPNQEPTVEVSLKGPLLKMLTGALSREDKDVAEVVARLEAIRVQVYPLELFDTAGYRDTMVRLAKRLESDGWEFIVKVRDRRDLAYVGLRTVDTRIVGLLVVAVEMGNGVRSYHGDGDEDYGGDEVAFVNIVGDIDLDKIGCLGDEFHLSPLDSIRWETRQSPRKK